MLSGLQVHLPVRNASRGHHRLVNRQIQQRQTSQWSTARRRKIHERPGGRAFRLPALSTATPRPSRHTPTCSSSPNDSPAASNFFLLGFLLAPPRLSLLRVLAGLCPCPTANNQSCRGFGYGLCRGCSSSSRLNNLLNCCHLEIQPAALLCCVGAHGELISNQ